MAESWEARYMLLKDKGGFPGLLARASKTKGFAFAVIGVLAGIMLLIIPVSNSSVGETSPTPAERRITAEEYCTLLESKAESLINELDGVKSCRVVITLSEGYRYIYATDQHVREESSASNGSYSKQTDKTIVLAEDGNGKSPRLVSETMPAVAGVAVVCPGAGYETKYRIIELMCALFDIKSNRISVQS